MGRAFYPYWEDRAGLCTHFPGSQVGLLVGGQRVDFGLDDLFISVGSALGTTRESLIRWNQVRYPAIEEGRLRHGWELAVHRQEAVLRWKLPLAPVLESEPDLIVSNQIRGLCGRVAGNEEGTLPDKWRLSAETIFYRCVNPTRMEQGAHAVSYDPDLFKLAQARAEVYSKIREGSIADHPLCAGCVELTDHGMAMCGSLDPL